MDWQHDDELEGFLREFQPRQPRPPRGLMAAARNRRTAVWLAAAGAAALVLIVFFSYTRVRGVATAVDGPLYRISSAESRAITSGERIESGQIISPAVSEAFEVVSVKVTPPENAGNGQPSITLFPPGGSFRRTNSTLKALVQLAYGLQEYQVSGGPNWVNVDRYDVEARSERNANRDEVLRMIQTSLADRFQLKVRRETKEGPIYELILGRNGSKLASVPDSSSANVRVGRYSGRRSMAQLAQYLSGIVGRPVVDRTGLSGVFDIRLEFAPEFIPIGPNGPIVDPNGPSIFTALQEQLGLRLESSKGQVESLVIEGAERPQPN